MSVCVCKRQFEDGDQSVCQSINQSINQMIQSAILTKQFKGHSRARQQEQWNRLNFVHPIPSKPFPSSSSQIPIRRSVPPCPPYLPPFPMRDKMRKGKKIWVLKQKRRTREDDNTPINAIYYSRPCDRPSDDMTQKRRREKNEPRACRRDREMGGGGGGKEEGGREGVRE